MLISYLLSKIKDEETRDDLIAGLIAGLAVGLAWGLIAGLAWGLAAGLIAGLAVGLVWGLAAGLIAGLAWGLIAGLVWGLAVGLAAGLANNVFPWWVAIVVFIAVEILFWIDSTPYKPKNCNRIVFTLLRKGEALLEVGLGLGTIPYILEAQKHWSEIANTFLSAVKIFAPIVGVVGFIVIVVLLNSLKYREKVKK